MRFKEKKKEPNSSKAYKYLVNRRGLEPHIAAGLLGNLMQESYMLDKTWAKESLNDGVDSAGIMQWHGERLDQLYDFYGKQNPKYERGSEIPMQAQLDFILHEAETGAGDPWLKKQYQKAFEAKTPKEAAMLFSKHVIRPHKDYAHNDKRISYATELIGQSTDSGYDYFSDPDKLFSEENIKQPALVDNPKRKEAYEKIESTRQNLLKMQPQIEDPKEKATQIASK